MSNYKELIALEVKQPIGTFYLCKIKAKDLLQITYPNPLRFKENDSGGTELTGIQRGINPKKLKEIGNYIDSVESTFPNSIILAANYSKEGLLIENQEVRWSIEDNEEFCKLIIPSDDKNASIIDGQHRLYAFNHIENFERLDTELVCAVFIDLPVQYQAYIFATINFNQKKVDKSLAYEMYGYNLDDEKAFSWSPEKLAVFISRKLNVNMGVLRGHIAVAPQDDNILLKNIKVDDEWFISSATIVEGIIRLISSNSKRDRDELLKYLMSSRKRSVLKGFKDNSPLRALYLEEKDLVIEKTISNFFVAINKLGLFKDEKSIIRKTVGVQALFEILKEILRNNFEDDRNIKVEYFKVKLEKWAKIDFSNQFFIQYSGVGKVRIKNSFLLVEKYIDLERVKESERQSYKELIAL